jgi:transcriptional regulator with GAF, ATPase, and Fis domain
VALANDLYRNGLSDFLNVLDSERALFSSQSDLAQSEATVSTDVVALYMALGNYHWLGNVRELQHVIECAVRRGSRPDGRKIEKFSRRIHTMCTKTYPLCRAGWRRDGALRRFAPPGTTALEVLQ